MITIYIYFSFYILAVGLLQAPDRLWVRISQRNLLEKAAERRATGRGSRVQEMEQRSDAAMFRLRILQEGSAV